MRHSVVRLGGAGDAVCAQAGSVVRIVNSTVTREQIAIRSCVDKAISSYDIALAPDVDTVLLWQVQLVLRLYAERVIPRILIADFESPPLARRVIARQHNVA